MIRIVTALILFLLSQVVDAQAGFDKAMEQALTLQKEQKYAEAVNLLERIASTETDNWLPSYHLAFIQTINSFNTQDKDQRAKLIAAAEDHIATADALSPNNSEVYVLKGLLNTAKIAFEPMTYGPTLSQPTIELYKKAIALDETNPRAQSGLVEFEMGGARFFGQDLSPYCKRLQATIPLYDAFTPKGKFYPNWGKQWVQQVIKGCSGSTKKAAAKGVAVEATVTNVLRKGGEVIFSLFDSKEAFTNRKPVMTQKVTAQNGKATANFEDVQPGTYAIIVLHDLNGNNQMDFEPSGMPKENFGASNNVMRMGPPQFEDAKFTVENKSVVLEIRF